MVNNPPRQADHRLKSTTEKDSLRFGLLTYSYPPDPELQAKLLIFDTIHFQFSPVQAMKSIYLFLFLFLIQFASFAQNPSESDEKQVQQLIQDSFDGIFSAFDSDLLLDFYTSDFLLLEQGEIWDMDLVKNYLTRAKANPNPPTRTNRFDFFQTKVEGNRACIGYWNYATITKDGQVIQELKWLESATAVRTVEGWRLDMLHSTRVQEK